MDEWFKARLSWGSAIRMLSDAEAGRFVKALWSFAETGDAGSPSGKAGVLISMCTAALMQDSERRAEISVKRSQARKQSGKSKASKANDNNCDQEKTNDINCRQEKSNDNNCSHIRIRDKNKESSSSGFFGDDDEAFAIAQEHEEVLCAAKRAGLGGSDAERDKLLDLYAVHGKGAMLDALDRYAEHRGRSIAYLRRILDERPDPDAEDPLAGDWL